MTCFYFAGLYYIANNGLFCELQVTFDLVVNDNLGLMIRGGIEYGLGIYITGVDEDSAAFRNGLRVRLNNDLPQAQEVKNRLIFIICGLA